MKTTFCTFLLAAVCLFAQAPNPAEPQSQQQPAKPAEPESEEPVVFRSDVALARIDAQVLERGGSRAITGLRPEDFVIRDRGQIRDIKNFANEDMPVDIIILLDVSRSMMPHVSSLARASRQALGSLGDDDRVAVMVFDRSTRVHSKFIKGRNEIASELERVIDHENFNGGTDITRALVDAANYMRKNGRKEVRRAIVILTDDRTEFDRNEKRVLNSLYEADAILSALIAPDQHGQIYGPTTGGSTGGYPPSGGGGYPGGGGGVGFPGGGVGGPLGGVILGRRRGGGGYPGGYPGGGYPGGGGNGPVVFGGGGLQSAGTSEIARESGGDSLSVYDASAFQDTLDRIRQKYALYFNAAADGDNPAISVELSEAARRRYPSAIVRARRSYAGGGTTAAPVITTGPSGTIDTAPTAGGGVGTNGSASDDAGNRPRMRRRPVDQPDDSINRGPASLPAPAATQDGATSSRSGGWRRIDEPGSKAGPLALPDPGRRSTPAAAEPAVVPAASKPGGWRRATPEDVTPPAEAPSTSTKKQ